MAVLVSSRPPASLSLPLIRISSARKKSTNITSRMALNNSATTTTASISSSKNTRKLPVFLFDVMDTIVRDPFYHDVPAFFRMSMKELLECKHPTAWIEFEKGLIDEMELAKKFFADGRPLDMEGLKNCMKSGYSYIEGIEGVLHALKKSGFEMHAFTNYPIWYEMIEEKLKLSTYLSWTFCSCNTGKRKPEPDFYLQVLKHLNVEPDKCIFIDDRKRNVDAAIEVGLVGLQFKNVDILRRDLSLLGIDISWDQTKNQYQEEPS